MKEGHAEGARIYAELRGLARATEMQDLAQGIGAEAVIADLSLEFILGKFSDDLTASSVVLGVLIAVLIALRQTAELQNHLHVGLTNGLTRAEIEEAIVQTAPYAGFPAAWTAARAPARADIRHSAAKLYRADA